MNLINEKFVNLLPNKYLTENVSLMLYSLIKTCRPQNIIEVGVGYSTMFLNKAIEDIKQENYSQIPKENVLPNSEIYMSEYNPTFTIVDNYHMENSTETMNILKNNSLLNANIIDCDILDFIKTNKNSYDFVWLDVTNGTEYGMMFNHFFELMPPNGILIMHSTVGNIFGKLFVTELKLENFKKDLFEMITFVEPHKNVQNSFTIIKKNVDFPIYSIYA